VADIIAEAAMAADLEFTLGGGRAFRPAQVGCLPLDDGILAQVDERYGEVWFDDIYPIVRVTDEVLLWRLLAHGAADRLVDLVPELGEAGPLLLAHPSDGVLLAMRERDLVRPGYVLRAAEIMGVTPRAAVARAVELGVGTLDPRRYPDGEPDPVDVDLLRNGPRDTDHIPVDEAVVWLSAAKPVPLRHFLYAYVDLGLSVTETADRMRSYGFDVSLAEALPDRPDRTDLVLLSQDGEGEGQWFRGDREVPPGHVLWSAERTGLPVAEVCRRLRNHGLEVTDPPERQSPEDLRLLSRDHDGRPPWRVAGGAVAFKGLLDAAEKSGMTVADVAAVLTAYGLRPGSPPPVQPTDQDLRLFGSPGNGHAGHGRSVSGLHEWRRVWVRAADLGLSQAAAADRLRALGVACPLVLPKAPTELDHALLDRDLHLWQTLHANDSEVPLPLLLITAYELSRSVPEVGARLESYGLRVPDFSTYGTSDRADLWDDIALLSRDLSVPELGLVAVYRPSLHQWLTPGTQVPLHHLCAASTKLGIPLAEVPVRLRGLGIDVPDVADTVRAAMARLPRPSREQNPA
uniref:wHTH domain-containing protein n=1 Tax=Streptomyces torulosus TaxID=68276 RepID=UPI000AAE66EA